MTVTTGGRVTRSAESSSSVPCAADQLILLADGDVFDFPAELVRDDLRGFGVERAVDVHAGHAQPHELHQHLGRLDADLRARGLAARSTPRCARSSCGAALLRDDRAASDAGSTAKPPMPGRRMPGRPNGGGRPHNGPPGRGARRSRRRPSHRIARGAASGATRHLRHRHAGASFPHVDARSRNGDFRRDGRGRRGAAAAAGAAAGAGFAGAAAIGAGAAATGQAVPREGARRRRRPRLELRPARARRQPAWPAEQRPARAPKQAAARRLRARAPALPRRWGRTLAHRSDGGRRRRSAHRSGRHLLAMGAGAGAFARRTTAGPDAGDEAGIGGAAEMGWETGDADAEEAGPDGAAPGAGGRARRFTTAEWMRSSTGAGAFCFSSCRRMRSTTSAPMELMWLRTSDSHDCSKGNERLLVHTKVARHFVNSELCGHPVSVTSRILRAAHLAR